MKKITVFRIIHTISNLFQSLRDWTNNIGLKCRSIKLAEFHLNFAEYETTRAARFPGKPWLGIVSLFGCAY